MGLWYFPFQTKIFQVVLCQSFFADPRQPTDYFIKKQFELFDMIQAEKTVR